MNEHIQQVLAFEALFKDLIQRNLITSEAYISIIERVIRTAKKNALEVQ